MLVFANKQDVDGKMGAAEIARELNLVALKDLGVTWHIQARPSHTGPITPPLLPMTCVGLYVRPLAFCIISIPSLLFLWIASQTCCALTGEGLYDVRF